MIQLHTATVADLDEVIAMGEQLQEESKPYEPLLVFDREQSHNHYRKELSNEMARIIVAVNESGELVGYQYSYVSVLEYLAEANRECVLEALYVKPDYRGKGIAKLLVQNAEYWAVTEMKANRIKAGIYSGNVASEQVHLKDGFVPYYTEYIKYPNKSE